MVSLFHTRLAIQDPTADGNQPMFAANGQVVITYNGEIYNFRELRAQLAADGYRFRSHTDTEVLLALYLKHGTELLGFLNGIYAFAIWDARSGSLFVARDGLGVKPLYISEAGGAFAFASEVKALLLFPWIERTLDLQALAHYTRFLWCPGERTPLAEVRKVEPGEALIVRQGTVVRRWRHYRLPTPPLDGSRTPHEWTQDVRNSIGKAVERQMVSDVPLGAFLSGGLDSSAVVAHAREHAKGRLQCFTIDFDDVDARKEGLVRDLPYAERVARHLDVDLHVVRVGPEMVDELAHMVWQLDEPQGDLAPLNVLFISRLARSHGVKVLLSGAGGDDLFTGYRRHRALMLSNAWRRMPASLRGLLASAARCFPARPTVLRRISRFVAAGQLEGNALIASYFDWLPPGLARDVFVRDIDSTLADEPLLAALRAMPSHLSPLQRMLLLEQRYFLADHNLNYTDKMSMAAGVEVRVPFLDPELVALAARIPDAYRQRGAVGKWILKKAMQGRIPDDVIYRPKTGFGVPLRAWLQGRLRPLLYDLLGTDSVNRRGLLRAEVVARMIDDNQKGRADNAYSLLALMCLESWCRQFLDGPRGGVTRVAA